VLVKVLHDDPNGLVMGDFIGLCVIGVLALSPLLRRFYIDRFWVHAHGTVIRLDLVISDNEESAWVWTPIIEYRAAGQQFSSRVFPFRHRLNAKKYSVGDEVDILYDPRDPSRVMLNSWAVYILCTILLSGWLGFIIVDRLHNAR
jgi:hypothetical protein